MGRVASAPDEAALENKQLRETVSWGMSQELHGGLRNPKPKFSCFRIGGGSLHQEEEASLLWSLEMLRNNLPRETQKQLIEASKARGNKSQWARTGRIANSKIKSKQTKPRLFVRTKQNSLKYKTTMKIQVSDLLRPRKHLKRITAFEDRHEEVPRNTRATNR